ncbi:isocitrate/isopropylmalate family dehydrogenase [Methanolobus bombayensis]|uniref:isocitrate/isopropylmalate family dehydrogenase n=1 Tax=Methanolobus bombayensis TaxID=38023 RepID=UPI001AE69EAA|nr:isocitrate/isopropylmalate family dehydrogenase [Methanolobus bombayensis]MBP1908182.1 methanogen homoisocitrate dehydrogenase [Methanolobus bombayensis]
MKLAVVEGDGVGKEVIPAALEVLDAFGLDVEKIPMELGYGRWERTGSAITEEDIDALKDCDCVLFGAVTTPPDPNYKSVLLTIRKELDMYANVRPIRPLLSVKGIHDRTDFNYIIVRENTEGLYSGIEEIGEEISTTKRVVTKKGSKRIADYASKLASNRTNKLTIVHKSNVMKSDKLFLDVCRQSATDAGVTHSDELVDSFAYNLIKNPWNYDVIVTTNLFGDILSDMSGALVGGLGLLPSANIGEKYAFFEPVHGSAPDIAGKNIANPLAAILSLKMLLEWNKNMAEATILEEAIDTALNLGLCTPDLGGKSTTSDVGEFLANYIKTRLE